MKKQTVSYDPAVINEFAYRLYRQAASIILKYTVLGLLVGGAISGVVAVGTKLADGAGFAVLIGLLLGGAFGYSHGKEKAFKLKLEAQIALCQVQIETNTRSPAS